MLPGIAGLGGKMASGKLTELILGTLGSYQYLTIMDPKARITCIGAGQRAYQNSYQNSGGAGAIASSIITGMTVGGQLRVYPAGGGYGWMRVETSGGTVLVSAPNARNISDDGNPSLGGQVSDCVGTIKYAGGNGDVRDTYSSIGTGMAGGGAAGLSGAGSNGGGAGGARGPGSTWFITASGLVVRNGNYDENYGGGGSVPANNYTNGPIGPAQTVGAAIIEWGYEP